jgi:hypothetical protein
MRGSQQAAVSFWRNMRYRALDANGDMTFGQGSANFLVNSPAAVEQAILTGLRLFQGEFFLNNAAGMPWFTDVIGVGKQGLYDTAINNQILGTNGVTGVTSYSSSLNTAARTLAVSATVMTAYSPTPITISTTLSLAPGA